MGIAKATTTDTTHKHAGDKRECVCRRCSKFASIDLTERLLKHATIETEWHWVTVKDNKVICPAIDATAMMFYLTDAHIEIQGDTFTIQTMRGEHYARWHRKDMADELVRFALKQI